MGGGDGKNGRFSGHRSGHTHIPISPHLPHTQFYLTPLISAPQFGQKLLSQYNGCSAWHWSHSIVLSAGNKLLTCIIHFPFFRIRFMTFFSKSSLVPMLLNSLHKPSLHRHKSSLKAHMQQFVQFNSSISFILHFSFLPIPTDTNPEFLQHHQYITSSRSTNSSPYLHIPRTYNKVCTLYSTPGYHPLLSSLLQAFPNFPIHTHPRVSRY